jgi:hypothetical protein
MRLDDLAVRLAAVEAKLATLTGTVANAQIIDNAEEFDRRLSVVEVQVDQLIAAKTQEQVAAIVAAPADAAPVPVEAVVALSPSAADDEAAAVVADVVTAMHEAEAIEHPEVAAVVAAAVAAVVAADPEVVKDPDALAELIKDAVTEAPVPSQEVAQAAVDAVADVVAAATGADVAPEAKAELAAAVAEPADPVLDKLEERLVAAEAKVDSLLGK